MAIAQVQQTVVTQTASNAVMTCGFTANATPGNLLTMAGVEFDNILISSITGCGTWAKYGNTASSTVGTLEQWYCLAATASEVVTITLASTPGNTRGSYQVTEWSGGPWYAGATSATSNAAASTTVYSPSMNPATSGALVIAMGVGGSVFTVPPNSAGWTDDTAMNSYSWWNNSYQVADWAYIVDSTTTTEQCNWTQATSGTYSSNIATFLTAPAVLSPLNVSQSVMRAATR